MNIIIQQYNEAYKDEVLAVILDIQQNEFSIPIKKADQPDLDDIPGVYQTGAGNFWVAIDNGHVIGTIALLDIGNYQAALRKLFVHAAYRGSYYNTAKLLLAKLLQWAGKNKIEDIFLGTTAQFLAAHRFYEKNGFNPIRSSSLPVAFLVMKVDTKFYHYRLVQ
ncbi:MAG: GNAT family N-acetyltransferase [Sporomusa sp.]